MQQGDFLKIPQTGDRGSVFCPAISENFETLDGHTHDGLDSNKILSSSLTRQTLTIPIADFEVETDGDYKASVTLPAGYGFDSSLFKFIIASGPLLGHEINPTIIKTSDTAFDVKIYTNTFDLKVVIL